MNPNNFSGTRARCQRIRDVLRFNGWVHEITDSAIFIRFEETPELAIGDQIAFEVFGDRMNLLVIGKFAGVSHSCKRISVTGTIVSDQTFQFELVSSVRILRGKENYRQLAEQLSLICRIVVDEEEHEYAVVDVSPEGVGLVGWPEIARDSVVPIEFDSASGVIKCKAEVRYCRLTKDKAAYRLGLRLEFDDRISRGRWIQLFSEKAA